jgi:hypothetical protein
MTISYGLSLEKTLVIPRAFLSFLSKEEKRFNAVLRADALT